MLCSIDICENKVSADQYRGLKFRTDRGYVYFFKLTADQVPGLDWIVGSSEVNLL